MGENKVQGSRTGHVSVSPAGDRLRAAAGPEPCEAGGVGFRPQRWPPGPAWEASRGPVAVEDSRDGARGPGPAAGEEYGCQN